MQETPEFSRHEEERIQQKKEEFQNAVEELKKQHTSGGFGIDPGNDPIAREAMIRLMEQNIEQALASHSGQALAPDETQRIRAEVREQVNGMFARNTTT